jgi:plastocyanin
MIHARSLRSPLGLAALLAGLGGSVPALAATTVKGSVVLPTELKSGRRFFGHWRVENTNVAVPPANLRGGTVVVLTGLPFQAVPPKSVPVEITGLQANPATVVISEGTSVEFKNGDKVAHDLSIPGQSQIMPPERLGAGTVRKVRFATKGEYIVRCTEYPHIIISVLVTNSPLYGVVDDKGAFRISDVPEGHATLKVWSGERWVKEAEVDVPARGLDLTVKVPSPSGTALPVDPSRENTE